MMMPIMIGLQMVISVSQLEEGERTFSDLGRVKERWSDKEKELQSLLVTMPAIPDDPDAQCPAAPQGFVADIRCSFIEVNDANPYVARIYRSDIGWAACFVSKGRPNTKCSNEVAN